MAGIWVVEPGGWVRAGERDPYKSELLLQEKEE